MFHLEQPKQKTFSLNLVNSKDTLYFLFKEIALWIIIIIIIIIIIVIVTNILAERKLGLKSF